MKKTFPTLLLVIGLIASCARPTPPLNNPECQLEVLANREPDLSSPLTLVYSLCVKNFTPNEKFHVYTVTCGHTPMSYGVAYVSDTGRLMQCCGGEWRPLVLNLSHYATSEYVDLYLTGFQPGRYTSVHIVPHPLRVILNGYDLSLEKCDYEGNTFRIIGKGFQPGEKVSVMASTNGRYYTYPLYANATGEVLDVFYAVSGGLLQGDFYIELTGCNGSIELGTSWGKKHCQSSECFRLEKEQEERLFQLAKQIREYEQFKEFLKCVPEEPYRGTYQLPECTLERICPPPFDFLDPIPIQRTEYPAEYWKMPPKPHSPYIIDHRIESCEEHFPDLLEHTWMDGIDYPIPEEQIKAMEIEEMLFNQAMQSANQDGYYFPSTPDQEDPSMTDPPQGSYEEQNPIPDPLQSSEQATTEPSLSYEQTSYNMNLSPQEPIDNMEN